MHGVVQSADGGEIEHRVEGRHFEHADFRHAEQIRGSFDGLLRQPAAALLLRAPKNRNHR
jgi:hypothetical protein